MNIKTRMQLGVTLSLFVIGMVALFVFSQTRAMNEMIRLEGVATQIIKGVAEIKIVTHEYLLHPQERSLMQWQSRYSSLLKLLSENDFKRSDDKSLSDQMLRNLERFKTVFFEIIAGERKGERPGKQEEAAFQDLQERLTDEILLRVRLVVSLGFQLQQQLELKLMNIQERVVYLVTILILTFAATVVGIFLWIGKSVVKPVVRLGNDTRIIGSGNLNHKIGSVAKDEIGELSRAFDKMTSDLKESTTSIVELNKEIRDRKAAVAALRESEMRFRGVFESEMIGTFFWSADGKITDANDCFLQMVGYTSDEALSGEVDWKDMTPPEYAAQDASALQEIVATGAMAPIEKEFIREDGSRIPILVGAASLPGPKLGGVAFVVDITSRKQAESAMAIKDKAISSSINGIALSDLEGNLTFVNESFLKMWGYDEAEVLGRPFADFWLEEKESVKAMKTLMDTGVWTGELTARRKEGSLFDAQVLARLVRDDMRRNVCVVSSFIDVTNERMLQNELIRSERLAASGGLAASIAHEINSPLQGITSIISSIERTHKQDEGLAENLNLIKGGFTSIRDIVKRLLDLNRPGKEKKQPMSVNSVIEDTVSLLKGHLKKNGVKVTSSLSSKVPMIVASPQELGQVVLNLINNSVEAMAGVSNGKEIMLKSNLRGKNVVIKVADTGPGVPKEAMKKIFDPFYTRKKKMGMGIGLSICYGIMEDHNGSIAARNAPDGGAVFTITLPAG